MAIGFLFLGGGKYTLNTSNISVAMLLCSLYPQWPNLPNDNRYHLQALRHLYVIGVQSRCIQSYDIDTNQLCYVPIQITFSDPFTNLDTKLNFISPCIIPEHHMIKEIKVMIIHPYFFIK